MAQSWKNIVVSAWKGWGYSLVIAVLITSSFKSAIADWNDVPTGSMLPTIVEGDRIFVNKLAYDLKIPYTTRHLVQWDHPRHGEIVVFYSPSDGTRLVKRVVGLPGDTLTLHNNVLFINGQPLPYSAAATPQQIYSGQQLVQEDLLGTRHPVLITPAQPALRSFAALTVPAGHYFMLGDNRDNSADSRYFGPVARQLIVGRASHVVASLDIHDRYQPRWSRFFTALR